MESYRNSKVKQNQSSIEMPRHTTTSSPPKPPTSSKLVLVQEKPTPPKDEKCPSHVPQSLTCFDHIFSIKNPQKQIYAATRKTLAKLQLKDTLSKKPQIENLSK